MESHVRILGVLHIVFGLVGLLGGLVALLFFGGLAGLVGWFDASEGAFIAIPILSAIGGIAFLIAACLAAPSLIAGFGLLGFRSWARILTIVLSAFELLNFPLGTALAVYGFWVLLSPEGERLFRTGRSLARA